MLYVAFFLIVGGAIAWRVYNELRLKESGANVTRDYDAIRTRHIYASPYISTIAFWNALDPSSLKESGAEAQLLEGGAIRFVSVKCGYEAILDGLEDEGDDKRLYFCITNWRVRNGGIVFSTQMNVLLTSVEKTLLSIDPFVTVRHERMATNTRSKLI